MSESETRPQTEFGVSRRYKTSAMLSVTGGFTRAGALKQAAFENACCNWTAEAVQRAGSRWVSVDPQTEEQR